MTGCGSAVSEPLAPAEVHATATTEAAAPPVPATLPPPTPSILYRPTPLTSRSGADLSTADLGEQGFATTTTMPEEYFWPWVVRVEPLPGTVALTFDDGPDPVWTPVVLDILKERGASATFFVNGWKVDAYPELARRIVEEGHSLQSHAHHHHDLTAVSDEYMTALIGDTADAVFRATGTTPLCLRPPYGLQNARVRRFAAAEGHRVILWTKDSDDYYLGSAARLVDRSREWGAGDVVVMHDTWGVLHQDALPVILDNLADQGIGTSAICVSEPQEPANRGLMPAVHE